MGTTMTYKKAITDLVNIYAEVDVLTMELCAAWLPKAPDRHAQLDMAEQIGEERVHYLSQVAWLDRHAGGPTQMLPESWTLRLRELVNGMQWPEYLASVHLAIEGVGIAIVERAVRDADDDVKACLAPSLRDEGGHSAFAIRQLKRLLDDASPEDRAGIRDRIVAAMRAIHRLADTLPVSSAHWEAVGTSTEEVRQISARRTTILMSTLGFPTEARVA